MLTGCNVNIRPGNEFTITFETDGAERGDFTQSVERGGRVVMPEPPMKRGFAFVTWVDKEDMEPFDFDMEIERDYILLCDSF